MARFSAPPSHQASPGFDAAKTQFLNDTRTIYIVIGVVLVVVLAVFALFKLPTPPGDKEEAAGGASSENSSF